MCTELVVYLALHRRGASLDELDDALWPGNGGSTRRTEAIARTRRWLGIDTTSAQLLAPMAGGRLQLRPGVLLDWDLFQRLSRRGRDRGTAGTADLHRALDLVSGQPFEAVPTSRYRWVAELYIGHDIAAAVIDTAHMLARRLLDAMLPLGPDAPPAPPSSSTGTTNVRGATLWRPST